METAQQNIRICDACKKEQPKGKLIEAKVYQGTMKDVTKYKLTEIETNYTYVVDKEYFIYEICHKCIKNRFVNNMLLMGGGILTFVVVMLWAGDWFTFYQNLFLIAITSIVLYLGVVFLALDKGTARTVAGDVAVLIAEKEFEEEKRNIPNFCLFTETDAYVIIESERLKKEGKL